MNRLKYTDVEPWEKDAVYHMKECFKILREHGATYANVFFNDSPPSVKTESIDVFNWDLDAIGHGELFNYFYSSGPDYSTECYFDNKSEV